MENLHLIDVLMMLIVLIKCLIDENAFIIIIKPYFWLRPKSGVLELCQTSLTAGINCEGNIVQPLTIMF